MKTELENIPSQENHQFQDFLPQPILSFLLPHFRLLLQHRKLKYHPNQSKDLHRRHLKYNTHNLQFTLGNQQA